jgi:drug/metabolite transporter (DMT)-like permease
VAGVPQRPSTPTLFAVCVLVWSTTWYAITWQLDAAAAEVGVAVRFALAGLAVLALSAARGEAWRRLGAAQHGHVALQGMLLYGISYVCVYHAERRVPSGLVAVGYSASPLLTGLAARALFGTPLPRGFTLGGLLGVAGVALIFAPEFARARGGDRGETLLGALFTAGAVLLSAAGNVVASRNHSAGVPMWPAIGLGMLWGALAAALAALALGRSFVLPTEPSWWIALLYLSLAGSVLTFVCYLTLQARVGPGQASTIGVMTPLLALVVSMAFEAYRPGWATAAGVALALAGNVLMLRRIAAGTPLRRAAAAGE